MIKKGGVVRRSGSDRGGMVQQEGILAFLQLICGVGSNHGVHEEKA